MSTLEGQKNVVTGGSRGLGLGIVEALVAQKAQVTVVARDSERLTEVSGKPMPPRKVGDHVVAILTEPRYEKGVAFGLNGDRGIASLDS